MRPNDGEEEQASEQETPTKDPEADCGHDVRFSMFGLILLSYILPLYFSFHLDEMARFCESTFFNHMSPTHVRASARRIGEKPA